MDYDSLRSGGQEELERLTGKSRQWTDFNEHDPGITILEQVAYALTDLSYRAGYSIPDLLSTGGGDPYRSLYPPAEILSSRAVTSLDLRKVALDVRGVRDAWVVPAEGVKPTRPPLDGPFLMGLHRILIDADAPAGVAEAVAERLHQHRNVGEDFAEIKVVEIQRILVTATVEIGPVDDARAVYEEISTRIEDHIAPRIPRETARQWWSEGRTVDEIFDGPLLDQGVIDSGALRAAARPEAIYTSKVIRAIADVPRVRAVTDIQVSPVDPNEPWVLKLDPKKSPRLDESSRITLTREGIPVVFPARARAPSRERVLARRVEGGVDPFAPPPARDRQVARYHSVQHQFPRVYGLGDGNLPADAPPERRALARQLAGYLMFYDQPMANYLAQLAHLRDLFAFDADPQTYFEQPVDAPLLPPLPPPERDPPSPARRNGFLDHLLARFAEQLMDDGRMEESKALSDKAAFLRAYPRISSARGTGLDVLRPPGEQNRSGLEERIALKLGLDATNGEQVALVEHVLLRHYTGSVEPFALPTGADPFSLQVTFVLPQYAGRFPEQSFRTLTEQTLREETPAHLVVYVQWLATQKDWDDFIVVRDAWLTARQELGPSPDPSGA
jgi:hypothetical protein